MSDAIRHRIRDVLATTTVTDPTEVAGMVLHKSTAAQRSEWLGQLLPGVVADVMRSERNLALNEAASRPARRMPSRSRKVEQVRDWWSEFLASRIVVGKEWKLVGDLTTDDLATVVAERRDQAARIQTQADRYEELSKLLAEHGVGTVRELPSDVVLAAGFGVMA